MRSFLKIFTYAAVTMLMAAGCSSRPLPSCDISTSRDSSFTGRGNRGELLTIARVSCQEKVKLQTVTACIDTQDGTVDALHLVIDGEKAATISVRPGKKTYKFKCDYDLGQGESEISLLCDIAEKAEEGALVSADIVELKIEGSRVGVIAPPPSAREVLLARTCLYRPGDYGSKNYRIPAICKLDDGSLLAMNDKRKFNETDLPEDIDIVARRSTDNGRSWSEPVTVIEGKGRNKGYGDPALAVSEDGTIFCAFSGGYGLWGSTAENPQRNYICTSSNRGESWSEPIDVTSMIWGKGVTESRRRTAHSAFFASGNGLVIKKEDGKERIMFVLAVADKDNILLNYAFWTEDKGATWNISSLAYEGGDEAKVAMLNDGSLLMSVRQNGMRGYSISHDGGMEWPESGRWADMVTNACDGDLIRYDEDLLLHSLPNSMKRENVSIFCSFDQGHTWPHVKSICRYQSVYSSIVILNDGTIGAYIEENPSGACELWYMNFSKDWLLKP